MRSEHGPSIQPALRLDQVVVVGHAVVELRFHPVDQLGQHQRQRVVVELGVPGDTRGAPVVRAPREVALRGHTALQRCGTDCSAMRIARDKRISKGHKACKRLWPFAGAAWRRAAMASRLVPQRNDFCFAQDNSRGVWVDEGP